MCACACVCGAYNCVVECLVRIDQTTELYQKLCLLELEKLMKGS